MMDLEEIFPNDILDSRRFKADIAELIASPDESLERLKGLLPDAPNQLNDPVYVRNQAERAGLAEDAYRRLAAVVKMLRAHQLSSPMELLKDLFKRVDEKASEEKLRALSRLLETSAEDEDKIATQEAFHFGDSFLSVEFSPLIVPDPNGREYFGANIRVYYLNGNNDHKVLALNMSDAELESLISSLQGFSRVLEKVKRKRGGSL